MEEETIIGIYSILKSTMKCNINLSDITVNETDEYLLHSKENY